MYKYSLQPYIKSRYKPYFKGGRAYLQDRAFLNTLLSGPVDYQMSITLSTYLDVVVYSKTRLTHVPAGNGVLVPAYLFVEEEQ